MAVIETWIKTDLKKIVRVNAIGGNVFSQDNMANLIGVELLDNGQPASVSGSVSANVLRADGATVAVAGTLSGNLASVTLPQAAYAVPGMLRIVIKLTDGSTVTTIGAVQAIVYKSSTDTIVDPGTIIPDIQALIEEIEDVRDSIPPEYDDLVDEVSDLESALGEFENAYYDPFTPFFELTTVEQGAWDNSGTKTDDSTRLRSARVVPVRKGMTIFAQSDTLELYIREYGADGGVVWFSGWLSLADGQYVNLDYDGNCAFIFRKGSAQITPADYDGTLTISDTRTIYKHQNALGNFYPEQFILP